MIEHRGLTGLLEKVRDLSVVAPLQDEVSLVVLTKRIE